MRFLIPTEPDDLHALLVKIALEDIGHQVRLLFTADHPTKQTNSLYVDNDVYHWKSADDEQSCEENDYDVVWWRRARKPHLPENLTHPEDYAFVKRENALFHESLTSNIAPKAWWINNKEAANRANFKILQLRIASQCKLMIPKTLCTNDKKEIEYFLKKQAKQEIIYKPLCSNVWFEKDKIKMTYTSKIKASDLDDMSLKLVPGIYQPEIKKKYELRVTCFGRYCVAAKIDSQAHEDSKLDWRAMDGSHLNVQPYHLPTLIQNQIHQFMDTLGIVFGSFDFIVTPDNEYIFLEVNEQGQFLWLDDFNLDFKLLDIFIQFICNKSKNFTWRPENCLHSIDKYKTQMQVQFERNMKHHVFLNGCTIT
ncbi:MAG: hypothetical protein H0U75_07950 [Legionella sp.]|nr:hypothetical protein [Legionella sp.]